MTRVDVTIKRCFDIVAAALGLAILWPVIVVAWRLAARDTGATGFFRQERVGRDGKLFKVIKIRTMRAMDGTTITTASDDRITPLGAKLRRYKIDELPQLWNVLIGDMSVVGPRPDVRGFLDCLEGEDRKLLQLRPGITGPASLKYRDEEQMLANVKNPEQHNTYVIWPDKVRINLEYMRNWSFVEDIRIILRTIS
ncbi:sugar transferase [Sulfitobacter sp. M39]|uniref:sugar transferase n=1 Tax=Sulfitobacter sp. M39 TaxID=2675334 RepID=UPI001F1C4B70|nr:sugar transferase [Sulfitobacter sp. M39]MCF7749054.1 sugar transferase [Sulfitobacter sp. M39]